MIAVVNSGLGGPQNRYATRPTADNQSMTLPSFGGAVMIAMLSGSLSSGPRTLALEQTTTLGVGELAMLHIPDDRRYSHSGTDGAWRDVLIRVRRSKRDVVFRAVRPGKGVIIISPKVADGECVSCATLHYFIEVVSRQ